MLAAVPDHGQNLTSALVLKRCEFTGSRAAAFVSDLIKDLSPALGNCHVTTIPSPLLALVRNPESVAMIVGNDTSCLIAQVNTLVSSVTEAQHFFLDNHLIHTSSGTSIEGLYAPVASCIPPLSTNFAINAVLELSPDRGTGASSSSP